MICDLQLSDCQPSAELGSCPRANPPITDMGECVTAGSGVGFGIGASVHRSLDSSADPLIESRSDLGIWRLPDCDPASEFWVHVPVPTYRLPIRGSVSRAGKWVGSFGLRRGPSFNSATGSRVQRSDVSSPPSIPSLFIKLLASTRVASSKWFIFCKLLA